LVIAFRDKNIVHSGDLHPRRTGDRNDEHGNSARSKRASIFYFRRHVIVASTGMGAFQQIMLDGRHVLHADEPVVAYLGNRRGHDWTPIYTRHREV
jgi:hypothetical protein